MMATNTRGRKKGGKNRFKGVVADARALEVSTEHLHLVLAGKRISPVLLQRYRELKSRQSAESPRTKI